MAISKEQGIFNFSRMKDGEKSYLVKLIGIILASVIMGFISGVYYPETITGSQSGQLGFLVWFLVNLGLTYWVKFKYDLSDWNDKRIFRHGLIVGLLQYLFWWTVIFNIIQYSL